MKGRAKLENLALDFLYPLAGEGFVFFQNMKLGRAVLGHRNDKYSHKVMELQWGMPEGPRALAGGPSVAGLLVDPEVDPYSAQFVPGPRPRFNGRGDARFQVCILLFACCHVEDCAPLRSTSQRDRKIARPVLGTHTG